MGIFPSFDLGKKIERFETGFSVGCCARSRSQDVFVPTSLSGIDASGASWREWAGVVCGLSGIRPHLPENRLQGAAKPPCRGGFLNDLDVISHVDPAVHNFNPVPVFLHLQLRTSFSTRLWGCTEEFSGRRWCYHESSGLLALGGLFFLFIACTLPLVRIAPGRPPPPRRCFMHFQLGGEP